MVPKPIHINANVTTMAPHKFEPRSMKEVLSDFTQQKGLRKGISEVRMKQLWLDVFGPYVHKHTQSLHFEGNTLIIGIDNATLKQEMHYAQKEILAKLNEHLPAPGIEKIRLR